MRKFRVDIRHMQFAPSWLLNQVHKEYIDMLQVRRSDWWDSVDIHQYLEKSILPRRFDNCCSYQVHVHIHMIDMLLLLWIR